MTKKEAKELLPIIQAWVEGKTLEYYNDDIGEWQVTTKAIFINPNKYRIKPESKYRPFKSQEECWQEMHKHPDFGWIKGKVTGEYKQVIRVFGCKTELIFNISYNSPADYSPEMMFSSYTFTDGTPFGIKNEE